MDLVAYARILRRRWWIVVGLACLGVAVGALSWQTQRGESSLFRATHTLVATGANVNLDRAAAVATAGQVPDRAANRLGLTTGQVSAQVRTVPRREVGFVDVIAFGSDPDRAEEVADVVADELAAYVGELEDRGREAQVVAVEQRIDELNVQIAADQAELATLLDPAQTAQVEARLDARLAEVQELGNELDRLRSAALEAAVLETFTPAEAVPISGPQLRELFETTPGADGAEEAAAAITGGASIGLIPRVVLGGAFGLLAGVVTVLLIDRLDPRLRTKEDAERVFGWPVLTEVPPLSRKQQADRAVLSVEAPRSRTAEAYRMLRSAVQFALAEGSAHDSTDGDEKVGRVVLVTSAGPSEGKTTTVANLATLLGEANQSVLVVNCDFRRPALGAYLGVDPHVARVVPADVDNVSLLAQVTEDPEHANPADVIELQRQVITEATRRFDLVVLDTAPLLTTNDANDVLDLADLVVVVARAGRVSREAADRCAEALERRKAPVLGLVLVAAADAPAGRYYYYGDYYVDDEPRPRRPAHDEPTLLAHPVGPEDVDDADHDGDVEPDEQTSDADPEAGEGDEVPADADVPPGRSSGRADVAETDGETDTDEPADADDEHASQGDEPTDTHDQPTSADTDDPTDTHDQPAGADTDDPTDTHDQPAGADTDDPTDTHDEHASADTDEPADSPAQRTGSQATGASTGGAHTP